MAKLAIVFGILIALISPVSMVAAGRFTPTALIPAVFGVLLILVGLVALKPNLRMHAMHGAALVALLGVLGGFGRAVPALMKEGEKSMVAISSQLALGALCAIFLVLCVKSFIDARRARKAAANG